MRALCSGFYTTLLSFPPFLSVRAHERPAIHTFATPPVSAGYPRNNAHARVMYKNHNYHTHTCPFTRITTPPVYLCRLRFIASHGIVHRDVAARNILLDDPPQKGGDMYVLSPPPPFSLAVGLFLPSFFATPDCSRACQFAFHLRGFHRKLLCFSSSRLVFVSQTLGRRRWCVCGAKTVLLKPDYRQCITKPARS